MWAKFDCNGADAYAEKTLSLPSEYWLQADVYIPASTLNACDDGDLNGAGAEILSAGISSPTLVIPLDTSYPSGVWKWDTDAGTAGSITPDTTITLKVHVNGTAVSWFADGTLLKSFTETTSRDGIIIGGFVSEHCVCEWYFVTNVKVGTTDGGTGIFADDFSGGNFTNWTSTSGSCTVVSAPSDCGEGLSISADPASGCLGDTITITGTGFSPSSPLTVTIGGITVDFSEADSDGSGNVSGTFVVPTGIPGCGGCTVTITVTDGDDNTATFTFGSCCAKEADNIETTTQCGPFFSLAENASGIVPIDSIHFDSANWVVVYNVPAAGILTTFNDIPPYKPLTVYKIPDDCSEVTSYDVDLGYCFQFAKPANAKEFRCQLDGVCVEDSVVTDIYWSTVWWFESWSKPVFDVRLATDGTTLWLGVLTTETVQYGYTTITPVDLRDLTSGYTNFVTDRAHAEAIYDHSCPPVFSVGLGKKEYNPIIRRSVGLGGYHPTAYPVSDGGDAFSSNWSPPRVVMFSSSGAGFTRIDTMDAKFCPGVTTGGDAVGHTLANGDVGTQPAPGQFFSGISLAASAAEVGTCHLVWSEGGDWGSYGLEGTDINGCHIPCVWDGGPENKDYRIGYSTWDDSSKLTEVDLFHSHIDRQTGGGCYPIGQGYNFTYDNGLGDEPFGFSWPATADFAASNVFQVRNDSGSPVLFMAAAATTISDPPTGGTGTWLDNEPWYPDPTLVAYDISSGSAVSTQTLDPGLLPDELGSPDFLWATFQLGFNSLAALAISNLYTDATLGSTDVYLPVLVFGTGTAPDTASLLGTSFYRIPGDLSDAFDYMDGIRQNGYSILAAIDMTSGINPGVVAGSSQAYGIQRFISEPNNVWMGTGNGPHGLDRQCLGYWTGYGAVAGLAVPANLALDGDILYATGNYGSGDYAVTKINICRGCVPCDCDAVGLHIWKRI